MKLVYPKCPELAKDYSVRSDNYYRQLDIIGKLCNDKKAIYRFPTGHAKVSRLGGDREELVKLYEMGRSDMEAIKEDIYKLIK